MQSSSRSHLAVPSSGRTSRPSSRASQRSIASSTRHTARIVTLSDKLIAHFTGTESGDPKHRARTETFLREIQSRKNDGPAQEIKALDKRIHGLVEKAHIFLDNDVANALEKCYHNLKSHVHQTSDRESTVKESNLPDIVQFLLEMSSPPQANTRASAEDYLERLENPAGKLRKLNWADILHEEPFEGQHWEGARGLPLGSTVEGWERRYSSGSSAASSFIEDADFAAESFVLEAESSIPESPDGLEEVEDSLAEQEAFQSLYRESIDRLNRTQYWRVNYGSATKPPSHFDFRDPSSLDINVGPSLSQALAERNASSIETKANQSTIREIDAVREVLYFLQGNRSILVHEDHSRLTVTPSLQISDLAPRLSHISIAAFRSVLSSFIQRANTLQLLRSFVDSVIYSRESRNHTGEPRSTSRVLEAFAAAVDDQIHTFDSWCANREANISRAQSSVSDSIVVSLMRLDLDVTSAKSNTFDVLASIIEIMQARRDIHHRREHDSEFDFSSLDSSTLSMIVLDSLLSAIRTCASEGDAISSTALMEVFVRSLEPMWRNIGSWLRRGLSLVEARDDPLTGMEEFFIERNDVPLSSPEFWAEGYTLRSGHPDSDSDGDEDGVALSEIAVPEFLRRIAFDLLSAGKSVGLLRALQVDDFFGDGEADVWLQDWSSFRSLFEPDTRRSSWSPSASFTSTSSHHIDTSLPPSPTPSWFVSRSPSAEETSPVLADQHDALISVDALAALVHERLEPWCRLANSRLNRVIIDECEFWKHTHCIEDLFLMQKGDVWSHFCDTLFERIDQKRRWDDYHTLNSMFRDVVILSLRHKSWIDPSLVRFAYRGLRAQNMFGTVRSFEGLSMDYQTPFPLIYIFGPSTMQAYSSLFVGLLQLRQVKSTMERVLTRDIARDAASVGPSDLKALHALRARFTWLFQTLTNYMMSNVIHVQIAALHQEFESAYSLDGMIHIHNRYLSRMQSLCFHDAKTSSVRKAFTSIFDLSLHFVNVFRAIYGREGGGDMSQKPEHTPNQRRRRLRHRGLNQRQRLRNMDVIGFTSDALPASTEEDEEEEAEILEERFSTLGIEPESSNPSAALGGEDDMTMQTTMSTSLVDGFGDGEPGERIDKIAAELDSLIRYVSRQVETLAEARSGSTEENSTFAALSFALEDWDL